MATLPPTKRRRSEEFYSQIVALPFDREQEVPFDVTYQEEHLRMIAHSLRAHFGVLDTVMDQNPEGTLIGTGSICYNPDDLRVHVTPDLTIAFGVDVHYSRQRNAYVISEMGKPPDFVLEVASPSTAGVDTDHKRRIYESIGVPEYWRFDKSGGDLYGQAIAGDRLVDGVYRPIEITTEPGGEMWGYSEVLGLSFCFKDSIFVAYDRASGRYVMTDVEEHAAYLESQAELEARQSELEAAQARVRELEEQLHRRDSGEGPQP